MTTSRRTRTLGTLVVGLTAGLVLAGCSGGSTSGSSLATVTPAVAAEAPATSDPVGSVTALSADVSATVLDPSTRTLVLATPEALLLLDADDLAAAPRTVALPSVPAQVVLSGSGGSVLVATTGAVLRVDTAGGDLTRIPVDGDVTAVLARSDGTLAAGLSDGTVDILSPTGEVVQTVTGFVQVDALVEAGGALLGLDRRASLVATLKPADGSLGLALQAGNGATNAVADAYGRLLVTNTRDGELLAFSGDPLILRQRYPVAGAPYALAFDPATNLVWVTLTATNQVVGYDVRGGEPIERYRFATVVQPDSVAVDTRTGAVLVASATGGGIQRIVPAEVSR